MKRKLLTCLAAAALMLPLVSCDQAGAQPSSEAPPSSQSSSEHSLVLSDDAVTLNGSPVTSGSDGAVTVSHDIIYYQADQPEGYGAGSSADAHTAQEAAAHTVVTIRQPGAYRVSGTLTAGQLAIDLGEDAPQDPAAVVTLILDGVDITCTVAPAVLFYRVYECCSAEPETAAAEVDTTVAGANVVLADGSVNEVKGSYVAKIYKKGTEKKLHKYDGAFYSKMSMNLTGETEGTGVLNIDAENEGLDSELHLTINGGIINIRAQNDGINTNEDDVSVITINGGALTVNAGLGEEGDGIDSNGSLVINGGMIVTVSNDRSPDGGIDADGDILIHGGQLIALGTRNDAVSTDSQQLFMELSFASTVAAGSQIAVTDSRGNALFAFTTEKNCQSLTLSSPDLAADQAYTVSVNGAIQQYTGNSSGGFGGHREGGPDGGSRPDQSQQPPALPDETQRPEIPDNTRPQQSQGEKPDHGERPEHPQTGSVPDDSGTGSTLFTLTDAIHSFSGVSDSVQDSGKTQVSFTINGGAGPEVSNGSVTVSSISASEEVPEDHIQITVTDQPSENFSATCLLSDGLDMLAGQLPTAPGTYCLTVSVAGDDSYAGTAQWIFHIPDDGQS